MGLNLLKIYGYVIAVLLHYCICTKNCILTFLSFFPFDGQIVKVVEIIRPTPLILIKIIKMSSFHTSKKEV